MNFTSRSRYALKIMMDLAYHEAVPHVHRRDIAARQGIPADYLDQIMVPLRRAGLVQSVRGRGGGYRLGRPAMEISLWELFSAVEQALEPVQCLGAESSCGYDSSCGAHSAWKEIYGAIRTPLEAMKLSQVTKESLAHHHLCHAAGLRECRGPVMAKTDNNANVMTRMGN